MKSVFYKSISIILAVVLLASSLILTTSATSFTSDYPILVSHDLTGRIKTYSNYTRAGIVKGIDPAQEDTVRIVWTDISSKYIIYIKLLDGDPNLGSNSESGILLKHLETSSNYIDIRNVSRYQGSYIKLSIQGVTQQQYTGVTNYYFYIDRIAASHEEDTDDTDENISFADYTGIDYTSELLKLYKNGYISKVEYNNRLAVLNKAKEMALLEWRAPVSFYTWRSSKLAYNSNSAMVSEDSTKTPSRFDKFVKGVTYVGIPYAANANSNRYGVEEWMDLLNDENIHASKLCGTVNYLNIERKNCTSKGIDCSGLVYRAMDTLPQYTSGYLTTATLMQSTAYTTVKNPLPGDILVKNGHAMIYVGTQSNGKICVFEAVADGENGFSGCRYYEHRSVSGYIFRRANTIDKT